MSIFSSRLFSIAAFCAVAGPIFLLASDVMLLTLGWHFEWTIGLWLAFLLLIPAVIGYTVYLTGRGSTLAYFGGASAFIGAMAGASMQVMFRVFAVLTEQGNMQAVDQLRNTFKLVASTQMIGLFWPIGLILLAVSTLLVDRDKWIVALALFVGAIAFPIGRIAGSAPAVVISGVMFVVAFGLVARQLAAGPRIAE